MDKMTIIGRDGKPRYEIKGEKVKDLRLCSCPESLPVTGASDGAVTCATCGGLVPPNIASEEKI